MTGPRSSIVLVVHLSDFTHALFRDIKIRSQKANYHDPVVMKPPKKQFRAVQVIELQVLPKAESR